ncbi:hypothetical protein V511_12840 [Mesotoga sp. Brook.08.YT.4.2.5.1]|nr:hypothetical protein V511_12840 [Mesotoga sp. Brook.08.YT.4.2.5.1]RAO96995.1 hypothetical protein M388_12410 [Mesotoga sp. Brook.08.YT.4.2.5.4.]RDI90421.1 hypothetical protein Q502_13870 [Mesotoga sp. Brook.08.YT.4.2.5.2.]
MGRAGEEQFFVPTLRVQVLGFSPRTVSRVWQGYGKSRKSGKRGRENAKNGTDVRSSSVPIFASRHLVVFNYDFGLRCLSLSLFSVDGGPLTDNVVLSSVQRVHRF